VLGGLKALASQPGTYFFLDSDAVAYIKEISARAATLA
jgi:hypothetical protein